MPYSQFCKVLEVLCRHRQISPMTLTLLLLLKEGIQQSVTTMYNLCRYRKAQSLPTKFLKSTGGSKKPVARKNVVTTYDRDIICLTKDFREENGTVKIPSSLEFICHNNLRRKIRPYLKHIFLIK